MKKCSGPCGLTLDFDKFSKHSASRDGHQGYCKLCAKGYKDGRPGRHRAQRYGLSEERYARISAAQGGKCAICSTTEPGGNGAWHIDHDHATGAVRGLLCLKCNAGIGQLQDSADLLRAAAAYLDSPPALSVE